jgi:hypothetical protein
MMTIAQALALYPHFTPQQIATLTGRKVRSVYNCQQRLKDPDAYNSARRDKEHAHGVRPMNTLRWPQEHLDILRALWMTHTARQIGKQIGRTKSAVIGMAHRLDLPTKLTNKGLDLSWKQYRRDMKQIEARHGKSV